MRFVQNILQPLLCIQFTGIRQELNWSKPLKFTNCRYWLLSTNCFTPQTHKPIPAELRYLLIQMTKIGTESPLACPAPKSLPASGAQGKPSHLSQASQTQHCKWRVEIPISSPTSACVYKWDSHTSEESFLLPLNWWVDHGKWLHWIFQLLTNSWYKRSLCLTINLSTRSKSRITWCFSLFHAGL